MRTTKIGIAIVALVALAAGFRGLAWSHCDTLDGPVVQDARKALEAKDATPVLKWVGEKQEKAVRASFGKALAARGNKDAEAAEKKFFEDLVRIHRAGEGAPYTGLKPAGAVEPAVAEADKALAGGSPDALVKLVTDDIAKGIRERYERVAAAYKEKDKSVADGRKFVAAYVDYTHFVEGVHMMSAAKGGHGEMHAEGHGAKPETHREHRKKPFGKSRPTPPAGLHGH